MTVHPTYAPWALHCLRLQRERNRMNYEEALDRIVERVLDTIDDAVSEFAEPDTDQARAHVEIDVCRMLQSSLLAIENEHLRTLFPHASIDQRRQMR